MSQNKSEDEWRAVLSKEQVCSLSITWTVLTDKQFKILRQKGTEAAGTGEYNKHFKSGVYNCAACDTPLYKSATKFDVGFYVLSLSGY